MSERAHPGVDAYIAALPAWQQDLCRTLRGSIWAADPDIEETIKRSVRPYFVLDGNVCALLAAKDHVDLFLYDPTVDDPDGMINQGRGNATACAIQIHEGEAVNVPAVIALLRDIVAHNRAGGWRRLQKSDGTAPGLDEAGGRLWVGRLSAGTAGLAPHSRQTHGPSWPGARPQWCFSSETCGRRSLWSRASKLQPW